MNPYGPIIASLDDGDEVEFTYTFAKLTEEGNEVPQSATVRGIVHVYDAKDGPTEEFPDGTVKMVGTQAVNMAFKPKYAGGKFHMDAFRILSKAAS